MLSVELSWKPEEFRRFGPTMRIAISNPTMELTEGEVVGLQFPEPLVIKALIDTGASVTVVNPEVAVNQKLRYTGPALLAAAGSTGTYKEYAAAIRFPGKTLKPFDPIRVVACPIMHQPISCLIGRDILERWLLTYDGRAAKVRIEE